jgi:C4-dicarboxylate-specific signal transduction histidine kinase
LLGAGGGLEGVVNLESPRVAAFTSDHLRVLEALATQASIALQEAKLLAALEQLTGALAGRSRSELFNLLIAQACDLLNVPHCIVWELDPQDPSTLRWRASNADIPIDYRVDIANSFLGEGILTRQPAYSADMRTDARVQRRTLVAQLGWVSALVVPLLSRDGQSRGAFSIYTQEQRVFSDWEQRLVMTLANHAAVAFQQAEALSEIKLAQERQTVAETFAVLGDVSANLLHRVNNLVGVIPQLTESLRAKRPDLESDEAASKKLADIETSARQAMTVARETFAFLRPFQLEPVNVAQCYQTALERLANSERVTVQASGLENLPPVMAGEEQLRLVLFNLMENAVEAIGEQSGEIKLLGRVMPDMLRPGQQLVELTLADSGPGVAAEHRDRIFDATFSTKGAGRKLGFGLWWVKSWIQRFGGSITLAEPEPRPSGCTFIIRLPVAGN